MVVGIGIDIIKTAKMKDAIDKWGSNFLERVFNEEETKNILKGKIYHQRLAARFAAKEAVIKIDNYFSRFLEKEIKIHASSHYPDRRATSGGAGLASSISWNEGSAGTCSGVTTYTGARIGQWTLTFSSNTAFVAVGPNCIEKAGSTAADFYDQTDATDSQICIPSANWGGTRENGDVMTFFICANFSSKTVPEIIYELLVNYAGISTDRIDCHASGPTESSSDYSFNIVYDVLSSDTYSMSFDQEGTTIAEAIMSVLPHDLCFLTQNAEGKFSMIVISPGKNNDIDSNPSLYNTDSFEWVNEKRTTWQAPYYNLFKVNYSYDYSEGTYDHTFFYPISDNKYEKILGQTRLFELNLPAVGSYNDALTRANRYWLMFGLGINMGEAVANLNAIDWSVGQTLDIPDGYNTVTPTIHIITKTERQLSGKFRVKLTGYHGLGEYPREGTLDVW